MLNFSAFFNERYGGAQPVVLFHGTHGKNLPSVLSQGLIPDPKDRAWTADKDAGFHNPSRASLGGIYLTNNLMTAISAAGNGGNRGETRSAVIVMVRVQPRATLRDEDDITFTAGRVPMPGITPDHEYSLVRLYKAFHDGDDPAFVKASQDAYVADGINSLVTRHMKPEQQHPELITRVTELLRGGWLVALERKISHLGDYYWKTTPGLPPRPEVTRAETAYARYMDQMTRTLKKGSRVEVQERTPFQNNMRLMEPIRFRGTNRILAVFEVVKLPGERYREGVKVRYPGDWSQIPPDALGEFKRQWEERVGTFTPLD